MDSKLLKQNEMNNQVSSIGNRLGVMLEHD